MRNGQPLSARDALMAGLTDGVVKSDILGEAVTLARRAGNTVRTHDRLKRLGTPEANARLFEAGRQLAATTRRNQIAPLRAIEAIEAATTLAFEDGCQRELEIFGECIVSDQAKALIYTFFAERAAAKIPNLDKSIAPLPAARIAIIEQERWAAALL